MPEAPDDRALSRRHRSGERGRRRPGDGVARVVALAALVAAASLGGCGGDERDVVLAIDRASVRAPGVVEVRTECARDLRAEVEPDAGGSTLPQITVRGTPEVGRCVGIVEVAVAGPHAKVVDGATSQVIEVEGAP